MQMISKKVNLNTVKDTVPHKRCHRENLVESQAKNIVKMFLVSRFRSKDNHQGIVKWLMMSSRNLQGILKLARAIKI
jgi:hypothetical protein